MNDQTSGTVLIASDIGNSSISFGFFYGEASLGVLQVPTHPLLEEADYANIIRRHMADNSIAKGDIRCIISSVVITHTPVITGALLVIAGGDKGRVRVIDADMELGIKLLSRVPGEMGSDRVAAAAGAYARLRRPLAVVDFGTATTVTVVEAEGRCRGGAIMAGLGLMNRALEAGTSRLKAVPLEPPTAALGTDTRENILSGLFYGTAGAVERIVETVEREVGYSLDVVVTGGHGPAMSAFITRRHVVVPYLVLEGLRAIDDYNR